MKYILITFVSVAVLLLSLPIEADSKDKSGSAQPIRVHKRIAKPIIKKNLQESTEISPVIHRTRLTASPVPIYKKATIRPTPIAIKSDNIRPTSIAIKSGNIRPACLTEDLQMGEALQIFHEYFDDSDYKGHHEVSGIRLTRDHETGETVYQVNLCPIVIYNDNDGNEIQASFFVDMTGEIFITERYIN